MINVAVAAAATTAAAAVDLIAALEPGVPSEEGGLRADEDGKMVQRSRRMEGRGGPPIQQVERAPPCDLILFSLSPHLVAAGVRRGGGGRAVSDKLMKGMMTTVFFVDT